MKKIISVLILCMICFAATTTFAVDIGAVTNDSDWIGDAGAKEKVQGIGAIILGALQVIGASIALVMIIYIAIKYMISSPNDRAELKKHLLPYLVGAIFIFGASRSYRIN